MTPARILVVEDDRIVSRDIRQQLGRIGHSVVGATARGEEAVQLAEAERPDLVLMDIRLEGQLDGINAAERIRELHRIPIIFLTAYADDETVRRASHAEPFGYLMKPFDDLQLRTAIEMALYKYQAERRLRDSERRYATTLSSIGDAVIATDVEGLVTFLNPVAEALTGWSFDDASGRPVTEVFCIVNEDTRATVEDPVGKVLRLGVIVGLANHTILIARDGRECPIDDCGAPIIGDHGEITGAVLVFRDIGRQRQMGEALRDAQANLALVSRLSRLGEFAASIAHEVNQPLTAIVSNADTVLRYLDEARAAAARVVHNGHRAGEVLRGIRSLVGQAAAEMTEVNVDAVVIEVLELMRGDLRRAGIHLETQLAGALPPVRGDRVQLQQLVLNLATNAVEAMTSLPRAAPQLTVTSELTPVREIVVRVADSGPGIGLDITAASIDKLFEPLVSTKPGGMGLGLSICRSIVDAHGGRIWVEPSTSGAVFAFALPTDTDGV